MSILLMAALAVVMVFTAFLSGIFGMAGGLILMGVLLALLPVAETMTLHAITQMASNGWRSALWYRHIRWHAATAFLAGSALAFTAWAWWQYVPPTPLAFLLLGLSPFVARIIPSSLRPNPARILNGMAYGAGCMALLLLTGVAGPLVDTYFLGGKLERREIVATKAVCQVFGHLAKLAYFGGLVTDGGSVDPTMAVIAVTASITGTTAARPILERLSDLQYRQWASRIIAAIASFYVATGCYMLL